MPFWKVNRAGPQWLMDDRQRVIGYKDVRGNTYMIPQAPVPDAEAVADPDAQLGAGAGSFATLLDKATADLPGTNAPLALALGAKADVIVPGAAIIASGALNRAAHANRQIAVTVAGLTLSISDDATGLWANDDSLELYCSGQTMFTGSGAAGSATLSVPEGYRSLVQRGEIFTAMRVGPNAWVSTTPSRKNSRRMSEPSVLLAPQGGTNNISNFTSLGLGGALVALDSSTTAAGGVVSATTRWGATPKILANAAAAAISRMAGWRLPGNAQNFIMPSASFDLNYQLRMTGGINDAIAAGQFGMGLSITNFPTWTAASEPSAMASVIMLAGDSGDAQLSLMHNDASGACVKEVLNGGVGFPNNTNAVDVYELQLTLESFGGAVSVSYVVVNLTTGVRAHGVLTTELPAAGALYWWFARG